MIRRTLPVALLVSLTACAAEPPSAPATATPAAPVAAAASASAPAAPAGVEQVVRAALAELAPGAEVGKVSASPIPGFQEVPLEGRVIYVSNDGKYLIQGTLFDIAARESLTSASESVLRKDLLATVGEDRKITFAAAQPKYTITVFTDIDCGYCQRMHQQIAEYNRLGITVDYLFYPRGGIGSESFDKAVAVWCAPDRNEALTAAKAGRVPPKGDCTNPVTMDYDLGRRIGLDGTPAIYTRDGVQLGGYLEPAAMLARLDELAAKAAKAAR
ncbi:MAG TPA: thioredoxin fold domain-containing protein [Arenimonas sp.]|uniref:thioredoxin fold domain-containing protein n=1 Tax=Arenimonas sp. TaxID=1872635 RepID=UPI002D7FBD77|nr:thioredoxin fold domain-containing protein [Arenimonas sp.]HEU0151914.1 thioredoxin fold domain-containing protein [Arenimonas sp.]